MKKLECDKCCGTGELFIYKHVKSGVCFSCNGTGIKHKSKRTKITNTVYQVQCEGVEYPTHKTLKDAEEFAEEVSCMHLEHPVIIKKETYTYKFQKMAAA